MKPVASLVSIVLSVGLVALAVACTEKITRIVPPEDAGAGDAGNLPQGDDDDDDDTTGDDDDTTGDDDDTTTKDSGPPDCKKQKLYPDCVQCCEEQHPDGAETYKKAVKDCVCTDEKCNTQCKATFCQDKPTTQACATCVNNEQASEECKDILTTACGADPKCIEFNTCGGGCQGKPLE